jgi:hypothetical protein
VDESSLTRGTPVPTSARGEPHPEVKAPAAAAADESRWDALGTCPDVAGARTGADSV